ncbi:DUF4145 domain-containing protein [Pseudophaeobacter sp.]|uniref:DUF4145 domain-containing protein n=1 Tax=Pseudophaeobacter sp. TaxID=1971739 RepID=UPI00261AF259|nr:DUF4145 domain-containing protein [Pseudophaeobacter sp.]
MAKTVLPSTDLTAFNCPNCGAFAQQFWLYLEAERYPALPLLYRDGKVPETQAAAPFSGLAESLRKDWISKTQSGRPFLSSLGHKIKYGQSLVNVNASYCARCTEIAIWIGDQLAYPDTGSAPTPNADLPEDIKRDYLEASSIVNQSPRGAGALLRLCVEKLCNELGQPGKKIDENIQWMVNQGLSSRVQKAMDTVRVIGNEAVHPGELDLKDDRDTVLKLFKLINMIAQTMISDVKELDEMYGELPDTKLQGIENRAKRFPAEDT